MTATPAIIAMESDGVFKFVKLAFDGYIGHTGLLLHYKWTDPKAIEALIAGGDIMCLGTEIGKTHEGGLYPPMPGTDNYTTFYIRDGVDDDVEYETKTISPDMNELLFKVYEDVNIVYCFRDGHWIYYSDETSAPIPLEKAIVGSHALLSLLNDENGQWTFSVSLSYGDGSPTLADYLDCMGDNWEWRLHKHRDAMIQTKDGRIPVALKLKFNLENDHLYGVIGLNEI